MAKWLRLVGIIDTASEAVARAVRWTLLVNAILVAGNAISRKLFSVTSPEIYDLQWHFLAAVVLLMAAYTLQRDEHVRVDIFAQRFGERGMAWLDLTGITLVLLPVCLLMIWVTAPSLVAAFISGENRVSREGGGIFQVWIIRTVVLTGFSLLALQGVAEAIRCIAALRGDLRRPVHRRRLIDGAAHDA